MRTSLIKLFFVVITCCLALSLPVTAVSADSNQTIRICSYCNLVIKGSYVEAVGEFYHPEHFVCSFCQNPLESDYVIYEGKNYHKRCFDENLELRCAICTEPIGERFEYNLWGDTVHPFHAKQLQRCQYCNRLMCRQLTDGQREYADGRTLCGLCAADGVGDRAVALALLDSARTFLRSIGVRLRSDFEFQLVRQDELALLGSVDMFGCAKLREQVDGLGLVLSSEIKVYALYGLPRPLLSAVLVHELMHVWQFENSPRKNDKSWSEGSCKYAEFLFLRQYSKPFAAVLLDGIVNDTDVVYGVGFRKVREFAEANGNFVWLERLRTDKFPPW